MTMNITSTKPFAKVISINCGEIKLYDVNENEVSMCEELNYVRKNSNRIVKSSIYNI
jgi:hypothetical protein